MEETKKQRLERLLFLLITLKTGQVDATLLKKKEPELDVKIALGGTLSGHKVPVIAGFEEQVKKAIDTNISGNWGKALVKVMNTILEEYGEGCSQHLT